jgi:hypothetical protein
MWFISHFFADDTLERKLKLIRRIEFTNSRLEHPLLHVLAAVDRDIGAGHERRLVRT